MGKKRTLQDLEKALTWRYWRYPAGHRAGVIGASRYKCYGFSGRNLNTVMHGGSVALLKTRGEVESAVWSIVANQPVASRLLKE